MPRVRPWPGWLVFILFVPLQIYLAWLLLQAWGFWATLGFLLVLGFVGNRAARAPWLMSFFAPGLTWKRERRRHIFQGILFLAGAGLLVTHFYDLFTYGPLVHWFDVAKGIPLLGVMCLATLVKAAVR